MSQISYLDGPRLRRSLLAGCEYAQGQRSELNRINVFPVPDGDTGTNLSLTLRAISDHLNANTARDVSQVAHEAAQGAVLGARGNCGMMLSHFLLGFADHVSTRVRISTEDFAQALGAGVERLHRAIEKPVEGTILTVMRDAATAARESEATDFVPLVTHVVERARASLEATPQLLPVLKRAGVVDAGAKGFVSILEGVLMFVRGESTAVAEEPSVNGDGGLAAALAEYPAVEEQYRFCVEGLVRGADLPAQSVVRDVLSEKGDSVIAIRTEDVLKVHVHADEPEEVFTYLRTLGTLVTHKAEDMKVQHDVLGRSGGHVQLARRPVSVVTDSACDLSEEIVRAHGIHVLPMALVSGDRTLRDRVDISAERFHDLLAAGAEIPTTSQPSPAAILESWSAAADEGEEVVSVFTSSTLSGAVRAAGPLAGTFEQAKVHVVDSLGASLLQGMIALKAAELGESGVPAAEIVTELKRIRDQSGILFTVRTFDRLIASGRVGKGKALIGKALGLKPILGLTRRGEVSAFGKAFGDERARPELLRILKEQIPEGARRFRFGVVHIGVPEVVELLSAALRAEYGPDVEILTAAATPVISTHLGIGAWGIAYMVED